jgi:hypothetical protein
MLRTLVEDPDRARLGRANRAFVAEHLGLERHVDHVVDLFARLLSARTAQ